MKQKVLVLGSIASLVAVLFFACSKSDETTPGKTPSNPATSAAAQRTTNNPYDSDGEYHNAALDEVAALSTFPDVTRGDAGTVIRNYFLGLSLTDANYISVNDALDQFDNETRSISDIADDLYTNDDITQAQRDYLYEFDDIMNEDDAGNVQSLLEALEQEILDDNISSGEKRLLLGAISVGWHSSYYWSTAAMDIAHPWYGVTDPVGKPKWLADARGYVIGFTDNGACPCFCPGCHHSAGSYSATIHSMAAAKM